MGYVPHTGEVFLLQFGSSPEVGESAYRSWVGSSPRLSVRDGDSGYARLTEGTPWSENVWVAAYLPPFSLDSLERGEPIGSVGSWELPFLVDVQIRFTGTYSSFPTASPVSLGIRNADDGTYLITYSEHPFGLPIGPWHDLTIPTAVTTGDLPLLEAAAAAGEVFVALTFELVSDEGYDLSFLGLRQVGAEGRLAIDTHDHPFHVVGTRDPAMPYELVIDTGTERVVEIVAGEEALATHELVIDETGRPGTPWSHCGLFRPI